MMRGATREDVALIPDQTIADIPADADRLGTSDNPAVSVSYCVAPDEWIEVPVKWVHDEWAQRAAKTRIE